MYIAVPTETRNDVSAARYILLPFANTANCIFPLLLRGFHCNIY